MSDIKLKIRHAKRNGSTYLDLSNCDISDLPIDIKQLTMLEKLNLANNKLTDLSKICSLPNLKEVHAGNNNISSLSPDIQSMMSLETLILLGNPIVNHNPDLTSIEKDANSLKAALSAYFGGSPAGLSSAMGSMSLGGNSGAGGLGANTMKLPQGSSFLGGAGSDLSDPA